MEQSRSRQQVKAIMRLRELVISGNFKPGERISELAMVDLLGISRTPVRLALGQLAYEGLLKPLSRGGFVVSDFSVDDIFDAIEIRGTLEGTAARMAAERLTDKNEIEPLRAIYEEIEEAVRYLGDEDEVFGQYVELNEQFHDELLKLAKCPMLERSLSQITALPFASPNAFVEVQVERERKFDILRNAQYQHAVLIEAIEARDGGRAFAMGQEHARLAAANLRSAMKQEDLFEKIPGAQLVRRD
ncbi:MAG: GntR family transcriptional regulator [Oceanospirillaceae bacterium]|nr:GntR family transcriptional regulator [Oceanospirillaceae bacterium]